MAGIKVNFAEVESSFEPLPEGRYECIIETVEVRESKSSDNDYLNWEFKVLDDEYEGRRLWMITSLSERALFRLKDTFLALGVIEEDEEIDIEWEDDVDVTPQEGPVLTNPEVIGLGCVAVVTNEVYEGKERNKVNEILDADAGTAPAKSSSRPAKSRSSANGSSKSSSGTSKAKPSTAKSSGSRARSGGGRQRKLK
jgi:hypothetical protein